MGKLRNSVPVAIVAAVAGLAMSAPQASAEIGTQVLIAGGGLSNGYGTGCTYKVLANSKSPAGMKFYDNGVLFGSTPDGPDVKTHSADWTPQTPGTHTIQVVQAPDAKTIVLTVGTGINAGSSCLVI
ncbi:hypothetical protein [Nocardia sp. NPDC050710]|uniref:hypothetical protein n=1 Tax=Nocardia sp. NPDC050710 TaxID=3157220 RepID=UPI0033E94042